MYIEVKISIKTSIKIGEMKMKRKKVMTTLLGVLTIASLFAGCGSQAGSNSASSSGAAATGADETATVSGSSESSMEAPKDGETIIKFGIHVADPKAQEAVTWNIVNAFNKKYDGKYQVEFEAAEKSAHDQNMKLEASDGTLPEIFWCDSAQAVDFSDAGYLLDLSDFLSSNKDTDAALDDSMKQAFQTDDGVQYGLPYQANVEGFFYNKKVLKDAGVAEPTEGTTFTEFLDMCKKLNDAKITPIAQGSTDNYAIWAFLMFLDRYGYSENIDKILNGKEKFNNKDMVACFDKMSELGKAKAFPENMSTLSYFDAKASFEAGQAAFIDTGAWDAAEFDEKLGDNIGFWWGPTFDDSKYSQTCAMKVPSAPLCVSAAVSKDKSVQDAVYTFLNYYYSKDAAAISYQGSVFPATNYKDIQISDTQYALKAVNAAISTEGWTSPKAQPDQVLNAATQTQLYDSMLGVMMGNYSSKDALQMIDDSLANS